MFLLQFGLSFASVGATLQIIVETADILRHSAVKSAVIPHLMLMFQRDIEPMPEILAGIAQQKSGIREFRLGHHDFHLSLPVAAAESPLILAQIALEQLFLLENEEGIAVVRVHRLALCQGIAQKRHFFRLGLVNRREMIVELLVLVLQSLQMRLQEIVRQFFRL